MKNGKTFVKITNREIFDKINTISAVVNEIHQTVNSHQAVCNEDRTKLWSTIKWFGGILSGIVVVVIIKIFGGK